MNDKFTETTSMTEFEKYKVRITNLIDNLDNIRYIDITDINNDKVFPLIVESSHALKEMMAIVENVGIANGAMANALQIIMKK